MKTCINTATVSDMELYQFKGPPKEALASILKSKGFKLHENELTGKILMNREYPSSQANYVQIIEGS